MPIFLTVSIALLACLVLERIALDRYRERIPLRICVTGTRGKSSVTRMLASILRRSGRSVVAKTTGSEARYILPDGSEAPVSRRGPVSILEQKQLVRMAARMKADCLVAEIMSIHPETHRVEAHRLLRPHIIAVTNVREDHTELMGQTREQISQVIASTICRGATVFLPRDAPGEPFLAQVRRQSARAVEFPAGCSAALGAAAPELCRREFPDNLDLVYAVASHLGIPDDLIIEGIRGTRHDAGRSRISVYRPADSDRTFYLVNAFAANDPESTARVLARVKEMIPSVSDNIVGILNLREDRVPRTLQWVEALNGTASGWFRKVFLAGRYPPAIRRRLPSAAVLGGTHAHDMTQLILSGMDRDAAIFGFGNFAGAGKLLSEHWASVGEDYGL